MPKIVFNYLLSIDEKVTSLINSFLLPYGLNTVRKDVVYTIPIFIKLIIYLVVPLIILIPLKIFYPDKKSYRFLLMFVGFLIIMSLFGVFIGFVQLLYS